MDKPLNRLKPDPEKVRIAKLLVGRKVILSGGGSLMNQITVVELLEMKGDTPVLKVDKTFDESERFTPILLSWRLDPIAKEWEYLPLGTYYGQSDHLVRSKGGIASLFQTVYDMERYYPKKASKRKPTKA